jgi:hypothetical protein
MLGFLISLSVTTLATIAIFKAARNAWKKLDMHEKMKEHALYNQMAKEVDKFKKDDAYALRKKNKKTVDSFTKED